MIERCRLRSHQEAKSGQQPCVPTKSKREKNIRKAFDFDRNYLDNRSRNLGIDRKCQTHFRHITHTKKTSLTIEKQTAKGGRSYHHQAQEGKRLPI